MPPNGPDDTSTLERLRQRLYAPQAPEQFPAPTLPQSVPQEALSKEGWTPETPKPPKKPRVAWTAIFLGAAILFFVIALAAAAYFLVFGGRSISNERISLTPDCPSTIASGDQVEFLVSIQNRNPVTVTATTLAAEFPDTARSADNSEQTFAHYEDTVGDIPSGETGTRSIRVVLFGAENETIFVPFTFEYRVEGSNATFVKKAECEMVVTSSPLSIRAEAVSEVAVGQPVTFAVTVKSNAKEPIDNVLVLAQYPFGFSPRGDGPAFAIGTLAPGEERTVTVTGTLSGENDEERVFRFSAGTSISGNQNLLSVSYATAIVPVTLAKPFLAATLSLNRETNSSPVIEAGVPVQGLISWVNTLSEPILDGQVLVKIEGSALEPSSIGAYGGYFRSSDSTILYSRENDSGLARLGPGADGSGTFSFRTKPAAALIGTRNPTVTATVSVAARRVGQSNVPESIPSVIVRTIKVASSLGVSGRTTHRAGPVPPVADQESTYAVTLSLTNTVNTVADTVLTTTLPVYVRYVGSSDPNITYNETSRILTWRAGEVAIGAGFSGAVRSATVEVVMLPSASQRGTSPILMTSPAVTGFDKFAERELSARGADITTDTSSSGSGIVR
ncbi:MAG TPA: hypothetical protein PK609_02890 [Candidatus Paceibacterota bacterium]|nr:hypothetical protein [Candidatus Paceibacterota bacterium]